MKVSDMSREEIRKILKKVASGDTDVRESGMAIVALVSKLIEQAYEEGYGDQYNGVHKDD